MLSVAHVAGRDKTCILRPRPDIFRKASQKIDEGILRLPQHVLRRLVEEPAGPRKRYHGVARVFRREREDVPQDLGDAQTAAYGRAS